MTTAFRRLLTAFAASNLADGAFAMSLPLVALSITRSPAAFASVTLVGRLPWLLFALPAGAFADRLDRRRTMTVVNVIRAVAIGGLAIAVGTDSAELWMLYVIGFGLGVGETLFDTAAQSVLPSVVATTDDLDRANGRLAAVELTTNQFIGPPLAAVIAGASLAGAVAGSAGLYLVAGITLMTMSGSFRAVRTGSTTMRQDIADGVSYLAKHELLRLLALIVGISNLASTAGIAILPLYMISPGPTGLSVTGYGLLLTTIAAGSVIGTTLVQPVRDLLGTRRTLLIGTLSFPLFSLVPVLTDSIPLMAAGFFIAGAFSISWNVITVSIRQRIVPDELLGRVNAGYRLVAWGTMPLGAALGGATAAAFGLTAALIIAAAVSSLCAPIVFLGVTSERLETGRPTGQQIP
jgi:MFS family permease